MAETLPTPVMVCSIVISTVHAVVDLIEYRLSEWRSLEGVPVITVSIPLFTKRTDDQAMAKVPQLAAFELASGHQRNKVESSDSNSVKDQKARISYNAFKKS